MTLTVLRNGRVHTAVDPEATALAITDGVVSWIGGEHAVGLAGVPDRIIDLAGALVVPGFVDAHVHVTDAGLSITGLDLSTAGSLADCLSRISRWADSAPGAVVWGHGWDETGWPERRPPTREEIDAAVGSRPAYLSRIDVHSALVSTGLAGRLPGLPGLDGHHPTAALTRAAHHAVRGAARGLLGDIRREAAQRAFLAACVARGVVAVHECAGDDPVARADLAALRRLGQPVGIVGYLGAVAGDPEEAVALIGATGADALGGDLVVDGALGSRTAALSAAYADDPGNHGSRYLTDAQIVDHLVACARAGVQPGFHAIGDDGVRAVADGLRAAAERLGPHGAAALAAVTPRIEHVEMISPDDIAALAATGTVASVQPLFDAEWGGRSGLYAQRLGAERAAGMNPFAALAAAGVTLALGSDAPVTAAQPWAALRAAVHHRTPGSGISPRSALVAHTRGGRRAAGQTEHGAGTISLGAAADLAIVAAGDLVRPVGDAAVQRWSTDPRSRVPLLPDLGPDAPLPHPLATVIGGRVVFDSGLVGYLD